MICVKGPSSQISILKKSRFRFAKMQMSDNQRKVSKSLVFSLVGTSKSLHLRRFETIEVACPDFRYFMTKQSIFHRLLNCRFYRLSMDVPLRVGLKLFCFYFFYSVNSLYGCSIKSRIEAQYIFHIYRLTFSLWMFH